VAWHLGGVDRVSTEILVIFLLPANISRHIESDLQFNDMSAQALLGLRLKVINIQ